MARRRQLWCSERRGVSIRSGEEEPGFILAAGRSIRASCLAGPVVMSTDSELEDAFRSGTARSSEPSRCDDQRFSIGVYSRSTSPTYVHTGRYSTGLTG